MPLSSDLLQPIPGDAPGGENLRYEPVYEELKQARTQDSDLPQGEWQRERKTADYAAVIKLATEVLSQRSKDVQVAAWLTEALLRREGFSGLKEGLDLLRSLMDAFWDGAFPEIEDGDTGLRSAPLEWVGQYLDVAVKSVPLNNDGHSLLDYRECRSVGYEADAEGDETRTEARNQAIEEGKLTPEAFDEGFDRTPKSFYKARVAELDACLESLAALDTFCEEKFADEPPSFANLNDALAETRQVAGQLLAKKLEQDPDPIEPETVPSSSMGGTDAAPAAGTGGGTAGGISPTPQSRDDAAARIAAAARFLRAAGPTDASSYLMLRGFRWGELRTGAAQLDPKLLAAPPTEVRTRLKTLMLDGEWARLLDAAEDVMATPFGRGWLDLQRYVISACDALGAEYDAVASAIIGALHLLLEDVPELVESTLMDDSPTANAETRRWLEERVLPTGEGEARSAPVPRTSRAAGGARDVYEVAMERVRAGQADQAVDLLMREAAQEKSARARFMRRSEAAHIMVEAGMEPVAAPILEEMVQQIEQHGLEEWEAGETVAAPLALLYRCLERMDGDESVRQDLYLRVCRLDPLQAIHFTTGASPDSSDSAESIEEE